MRFKSLLQGYESFLQAIRDIMKNIFCTNWWNLFEKFYGRFWEENSMVDFDGQILRSILTVDFYLDFYQKLIFLLKEKGKKSKFFII